MSSNPLRLRRLFDKYVRNTCSPEELQELWALMEEYADNDLLEEDMASWWNQQMPDDPAERVDSTKIYREILDKEKIFDHKLKRWEQGRRKRWHKWAVAAVVLALLSTGSYFLYRHIKPLTTPVVVAPVRHDVQAPQNNRAVITLANGQLIYLDSSDNGTLTQQGKVKVVKLDAGKVAYSSKVGGSSAIRDGHIEWNTLTNPRGSRVVDITLADGSRIWLNAGSSLTYPVAFSGNERMVTLTGEAYFEVVHDSRKPFRVKAGTELIEDMGTKFNVSAYTDDPALKTTLLEGAVSVILLNGETSDHSGKKGVLLKPGDQATVEVLPSGNQQILIEEDVNVDDAIAWKDGRFRFTSVDIATIMREVARWYDVDIVYEGVVAGTVSGGISRTVDISKLLQVLELTGKVRFTVEGKKVIVQPTDPK